MRYATTSSSDDLIYYISSSNFVLMLKKKCFNFVRFNTFFIPSGYYIIRSTFGIQILKMRILLLKYIVFYLNILIIQHYLHSKVQNSQILHLMKFAIWTTPNMCFYWNIFETLSLRHFSTTFLIIVSIKFSQKVCELNWKSFIFVEKDVVFSVLVVSQRTLLSNQRTMEVKSATKDVANTN